MSSACNSAEQQLTTENLQQTKLFCSFSVEKKIVVGRPNKEENKRLALRAEHKRLLRDGGLGEAVQEQPENGAGLCLSLCNERSEYRWLQGGMLQVAQVGGGWNNLLLSENSVSRLSGRVTFRKS